ncbi:MAG: DUF6259 domain-containing protein [Thermoproteota archaeon]
MADKENCVSLESDRFKICFSRNQFGNITSLIDTHSKHNFIGPHITPTNLWEAVVVTFEGKKVITNREAGSFHIKKDGEKKVIITWSNFPRPCENLKVVVTAKLNSFSFVEFQLDQIDPGQECGIWYCDFPTIACINKIGVTSDEDRLTIPIMMGRLIKNPINFLSRRQAYHLSYPGPLTMQWFSYYNKNIAGLYLATHDSCGFRKDFIFDSCKKGIHFKVRHYPENMGLRGKSYRMPYPFVLTTFSGDWFDASEIYRKWALTQQWCKQGKVRERKDLSRWFKDTSLWVWQRGTSSKVIPGAIEMKRKTGLNTALLWYWWHNNPYDVNMPEYLPPREGAENFKRAIDKLHFEGINSMVYINGRLWDKKTKSWITEQAEKASAKDENMKPYKEIYNIYMQDHVLVPMCPTTDLWKNKIVTLVETLVGDFGLDGIYIDQIALAPANLCYDKSHGHSVGGGNYWIVGYRELIRKSKELARKVNKDSCLASESCVELFIDLFDGFLTLDSSFERMDPLGAEHEIEPLPLFNAIYHEYAITFGSYASITSIPPYDELWPESTRPIEYGKPIDYSKVYSDQFAIELARTLTWGLQPMIANLYPETIGRAEFEEDLKFVEKIATFYSLAKEYLAYGRMRPPPQIECPVTSVKFLYRTIYTRPENIHEVCKNIPVVMTSAWSLENNRCCIILVNFSKNSVNLKVSIDLSKYGFKSINNVVMREYPNGKEVVKLKSIYFQMSTRISARSIVAYEFYELE